MKWSESETGNKRKLILLLWILDGEQWKRKYGGLEEKKTEGFL